MFIYLFIKTASFSVISLLKKHFLTKISHKIIDSCLEKNNMTQAESIYSCITILHLQKEISTPTSKALMTLIKTHRNIVSVLTRLSNRFINSTSQQCAIHHFLICFCANTNYEEKCWFSYWLDSGKIPKTQY